jgi:hypothetical protein
MEKRKRERDNREKQNQVPLCSLSLSLSLSVLSFLCLSLLVEDWSVEQVSATTAIERGSVGFEPKWQCH